jgi:type IV pilus assembly protein PilC
MPIFKYKAINKHGQPYENTIEVDDRFAVYRMIKESGDTIIYANEVKSKAALSLTKITSFFGKVKSHEKITFAKNLAAMIEAGLSVTRALAVMEKQTKNNRFKTVLTELGNDISKGRSLSESMKEKDEVFSTLFISMIRAGEESGNVAGALRTVALQMEKVYILGKKVKGALMYPAIIISLMLVITVLMLVYMVPTLTATFEGLGVDLPLSTQIIIGLSNFVRTQFALLIISVFALVIGLIFASRTTPVKRFLHLFIIKLPIIGNLVKEVNSARTARTLSSLLSSGIDILVAIEVTHDVIQNVHYKEVLEKAKTNIEKGEPVSSVFIQNEKLYPIFFGEMVSVGEETGKISDMFGEVAKFYEEDVDQKTKDLSTIIEPLLMIFIGVGVGIFAISMLAPTYSLVENI